VHIIQRSLRESKTSLHLLTGLGFPVVILVVALEAERMDVMRKVVLVLIVPEIGYKFEDVPSVRLEGAARGEVDVANDFVHTDTTRDVAALIGLFAQLFCPVFRLALQALPSTIDHQ